MNMKNPLLRRIRIMLLALSFVRDYWRISKLEKRFTNIETGELQSETQSEIQIDSQAELQSEMCRVRINKISRNAGIRMRDTAFALQGVIVKVGQFLSMREDLLPKAFVEELKGLQDTMPAEPFQVIQPLVEGVLGRKLDDIFAEFNPVATAAASLAQVHQARLSTGERVAVKILRPNIRRYVKIDLGTLLLVSKIAHRFPSIRRKLNLVELHKEFSEIVSREVDCTIEQEQLFRFKEIFRDDNRIHVPYVYGSLTRKEMIVMEYIDGAKISDKSTWQSWGAKPERIVGTLLDSYFAQLLTQGFVHLDPHPGNLYILRDGRVCFLDFGMVGIFDNKELASFRKLLQAIMMRKAETVVSSLNALGYIPRNADLSSFVAKVDKLLKGIGLFGTGDGGGPQINKSVTMLKSIIIDSPIQLQAKYMFLIRTTGILVTILRDILPQASWQELIMEHAIPIMMAPVAASKQANA
jgi:predicted unusual protein kinase regulating ubiquinone biosynthesis (AarF/ABC1/UbiB family)